jgi:hypothetical protein
VGAEASDATTVPSAQDSSANPELQMALSRSPMGMQNRTVAPYLAAMHRTLGQQC